MRAAERRAAREQFYNLPVTEQQTLLRHVQQLLEQQVWIEARDLHNRHCWSHRRTWADRDFEQTVTIIQSLGTWRPFRGARYAELTLGRWFYWTMNYDATQTRIINREPTSEPQAQPLPFD
jgi:hypothetical protein